MNTKTHDCSREDTDAPDNLRAAADALLSNLWAGVVTGARSHEENWLEFERKCPGAKRLHDVLKATADEGEKQAIALKAPGTGAFRKLVLMKRPADDLYFVLEHSASDPQYVTDDHLRYLFNEHSCPTNWIDQTVAVIDNGDGDPHGFMEFVGTADVPYEDIDDEPNFDFAGLFGLSSTMGTTQVNGWLYDNEDTGREFSENHPVQSGEVPDAKNIVTASNENLLKELLSSWKSWNEDREELAKLRDATNSSADIDRVLEALEPFAKGVIPETDTVSGWRFGTHPTPEDFYKAYRTFHLDRTATAKPRPVVSVQTMRLSDGRADHFVSIKVEDRVVHPHVFRSEYKAAYHVALYSWLLNGGTEPDLMAFDEHDWPAQTTVLVGANPNDIKLLEDRVAELEDELDDARSLPWPDWSLSILNTLKAHGYDPKDSDGTIDLGEAFADYLEGVELAHACTRKNVATSNELEEIRVRLIADLSSLVKKMLREHRKHGQVKQQTIDGAHDFLTRKNLYGSPLRTEASVDGQ